MANILFTSVGTGGDVLPLVRIGGRLKSRGHKVTLISNGCFQTLAAETGLAFAALDNADQYERFLDDGPLLNTPPGVPEFLRRHSFPKVGLEYELIRQRFRPADTILVTRHLFDIGARLAAEKLGIPLAWVFTAPSQLMNWQIHQELCGDILAADINGLRKDVGLPAVWDWNLWLRYPGRSPALWPDWFATRDLSWPADIVPVGFLIDNDGETGDLPDEMKGVLEHDQPPVLITAGTGRFFAPNFYTVGAEACRLARYPGVLVTRYDNQVPECLPSSIQRFRYLPFGKLMPSMAAIIHHGGRGTLSCALASGIPQVVLATGADRPDNATRLQQLGVADYLPPPSWKAETVAESLRRLTTSTVVRERCHELAKLVKQTDSVTAACEVIENALAVKDSKYSGVVAPGKSTGGLARVEPVKNPILEVAEGLSPDRLELLAVLLKKKNRGMEKPARPPLVRREKQDSSALSFGQERLWFLSQSQAGTAAHHALMTLQLLGRLDHSILEKSLNAIANRHEVWSSTFPCVNGRLIQVHGTPQHLAVPVMDLRELSEPQREAEVQRLALELPRNPFDLSHGPLVRAKLLRLDEHEHILLLVIPHIVFDLWSMGIVCRELGTLYQAFIEGRPSPLPEMSLQYADFAAWQRKWLQGDVLESKLTYWKERLRKLPPPLQLPTDRPRPAVPNFRGALRLVALSPTLAKSLKTLSRHEGATLFMTLLAAFKALLFRYTGRDDLLVGSPVAGRTHVETEGLIGFFSNTLVLRTKMSGNPTFEELLGRVRDCALEAFDHQDCPFEKLLEAMHLEPGLNQSPLFQIMFSLQNTPLPIQTLPGLTIKALKLDEGVCRHDLALTLSDRPEGLIGWCEYRNDLFDETTITRMLSHYQTLLEGIVADPRQSLSDLPILTGPERQQLTNWNHVGNENSDQTCIHRLVEARVDSNPEAVALLYDDRPLTYGELNRRANRLAHFLQSQGIGPGIPVGICLPRCADLIIGLLATLKAGGICVPLDTKDTMDRLDLLLRDSEIAVVVTRQDWLNRLPPGRHKVVCLQANNPLIAGHSDANLRVSMAANNIAFMLYSSGSSEPNAVRMSHRAVGRLVVETDYVRLGPADCMAQASELCSDAALFEIWGALVNGARLVGISEQVVLSPQAFATHLRRYRVSVLFVTAALFNHFVQAIPDVFSSVGQVLFGGDGVDPRRVRQVLQQGATQRLVHVYGPAGFTQFATWHVVRTIQAGAATIPIGRPITRTRVYVLDPYLNLVPVGVPGELFIGGPGLTDGFLNHGATEGLIPDPFGAVPGGTLHRTGDRGRYLPDGNIEFLGRQSSQVKVRGYIIDPAEIEGVLNQHPEVRMSVVVAKKNDAGEERLVAFVMAPLQTIHDLVGFAEQKLPAYKIPAAFVRVDRFPLLSSGVVNRRALQAVDLRLPATQASLSPRDPLEVMLAEIWQDLLSVRPIGMRDNFFELGGNLQLAAIMLDRIEKTCGRKPALATLFSGATIEHLARALVQEGDWTSSLLVEIHAGSGGRPFFFFHGDLNGGGFYCVPLARSLATHHPFYALHPQGLVGRRLPPTIEAMAAEYVEVICAVERDGPYLLGGYCNGALVAFETAQQLRSKGKTVDLLALIRPSATKLNPLPIHFVARGFPRPAQALQAELDPESLSLGGRRWALLEHYASVCANYVPRQFPGRVTIFQLSELLAQGRDQTREWKQVAQEVETHMIPGEHLTEITRHVHVVADRLRQCLDRVASPKG